MTAGLRLLCHASTKATRMSAFPDDDDPLEEKGLSAAAALVGRLGTGGRVLTSPALSARQTAASLGLSGAIEATLADCDFGRWRGRTLADIGARDPEGLGR